MRNLLLAFFSVLLLLTIFPEIILAGPSDFWKLCTEDLSITGSDIYHPGDGPVMGKYCCCAYGLTWARWEDNSCSYPSVWSTCDKGGKRYFRDVQYNNCSFYDYDNICRSSSFHSTCTADPECNGIRAGTNNCNATCHYVPGQPLCNSDTNCTDYNPCTNDKCENPGTPSSYCSYSYNDGAECGSGDGYYCNGNCKREYRNYYCQSGSCIYSASSDYASSSCKVCYNGAWIDVTTSRYCSVSGGNYYGCSVGSSSCDTNYVCITTIPPTTIPPTTIPPTTIPPTTIPPGCGNYVCEFLLSETQTNCPIDCNTTLQLYNTKTGEKISSSTYLIPNQNITVFVYFTDSRYNSTQLFNVSYQFWIDDYSIAWNDANGCKFCWKYIDKDPIGCTDRFHMQRCKAKDVEVYMENGYGEIRFNATLPAYLSPGRHKIIVRPVISGSMVALKAAEAEVNVGDGLYTFVLIIKNIFRRLTGFFFI